MEDFLMNTVNQFGYLGIFLLITLETVFPPIPSEVILTFGGFLTIHAELNVWGVILVATIGSVAGAVILYLVGRLLTPERLERLFNSKAGKLLHLKTGDVRKAGGWFTKRGNRAVFFCRFVPIVRSLISIPAGVAKMQMKFFLPLTVAGTFIWNTVLVFLGRLAGDAWHQMTEYVDIYSMIAIAVLVVVAAVIGFIYIKRRFLNKSSGDDDRNDS